MSDIVLSDNNDFSSDDVINDPTNDMGDDNPVGASTPSTSSSTSVNRRHNSDNPMEQCTLKVEGVNSILFNGEFYEFIERRKKTPYDQKFGGIIVRCVVCKATLKGSLRVSSNFISHMRQKHPNTYQVFKDIKSNIGPKRKNCNANSFHKDLLDFVANTASPLSIIEHRNFVKLFPTRNVPSRRTITQLLNNDHEAYISKIKMNLAGIEYLCMAADVWSGGKRSFFGYTCHWIDASSFERKSVALACRRFKGTHSFDHITDLIMSINAEFEVNVNKIICTITDNGSNFVKAFQEFGVKTSSVELESESNDGSDNDADVPIDDDYVELAFQNISPQLSKHFRCASHTLNLLGTKDFINTLQQANDDTVLNKHKTTLSRCAILWSKCNRLKSAEKIKEVLSSPIITPRVTRWNSLYDFIKKLLTHKHKLNVICQELKISKFHPSDFDYLAEYVILMQPIAEALDFLKIEKNMYFGYLLPTLISTKVKLRRLENKNLKYLHTATSKIQEALTKRFEKYFKLEEGSWDAVIAAMVCPDVKLKFFKVLQETAETYTEEDLKYKLRQYARQFVDTTDFDLEGTPSPNSKSNFFDFGDETNNNQASRISLGCDPASREINRFLMDQDESLECLHQYPILKKLFIKYNTPIPSSAPVERLFSFAGIVNTFRRQNLSDKNFEKLVIRKAYSILCK